MTNIEKFRKTIFPFCDNEYVSNIDNAENVIEASTAHTIGFTGWLMDNFTLKQDKDENNVLWSCSGEDYTNEKLLEIYNNTNS